MLSVWRDADGEPVDTGNAAGGRLPRGPNPRTSLARRLPRSPCAAPPVRLRTEGFFHLRGPRRGRPGPDAGPDHRHGTHSKVVNDSDGRQGRTASLDAGAPQPPAPLSGRPRDGGTAHRPGRGHRRAEPGPLARVRRRRHRLRHPRRRDPAGLRPADGLDQGPPHPRPPRAGRRPRGRGLRRGDRQGRRLHGDLGPGRDQPRHADRRRLHGLGADRRHHRPGRRAPRSAPTPSRRPTSAASRCRSPSTTTSSPTPAQIPRAIAEAFHIASHGPPGPGPRRHQQGRAAGHDDVLAGRRSSTCPATARSPGRTASRSARRPG